MALPIVVIPEALAELPESPIIIDWSPAGCTPAPEICGDRIDQDCNGSDLPCSGSDHDSDGYPSSADCDDNNRTIYPGVTVACSAACGQGTRLCSSSGSYGPCSCSALCEATGGGRCYYISLVTGNDSNQGTFNSPWRTLANIGSYYDGTPQPANKVDLQPGDVVYLMSGLYDQVYQFEHQNRSVILWNVHGTAQNPITIKAYPGAHPVIAPAQQAVAIDMLAVSHIVIDGIEVVRAYGAGVRTTESHHIELKNLWVHDTDGLDNNNIAGVYNNTVTNLRLHHSTINDNYDRTCADTGGEKTENSRNIVFFAGGNNRVDHNVIFHTPPVTASKTGSCVIYKHGQDVPGGIFEVDNNIMSNCFFAAIGTATYGGRFHHNVIIDSDVGVSVRNHGDHVNLTDNIGEKNTIIRTRGAEYNPSEAVDHNSSPYGPFTFRNNIVTDNHPYSHEQGGIVSVDRYGPDYLYNQVIGGGLLNVSGNCYHSTSGTPMFALFSQSPGSGYNQGNLLTLGSWQGYGFDAGSIVANPGLDGSNAPTNPQCSGKGHTAP